MEYPWKRVCVQMPLYLAIVSVPGTSVLVILTSLSRHLRSGSYINLEPRRARMRVIPITPSFLARTSNMTHHALSISLLYPHLNSSRFQHCLHPTLSLYSLTYFCYAQLAAYRNRLLTVLRPCIRCSTY
ncbi:hypothetical protein V8D89_014186 [Ganoderma adspersum]